MGKLKDTEPVRLWLYGLLGPALALLVVYGVVEDAEVALWTALGGAILVPVGAERARSLVSPVGRHTL